MDVNYVGENLLPGKFGQFFIILAFGSALFSSISYYFSVREPENVLWKKFGRMGFWLNTLSIIAIGSILFCIISFHRCEYHYAWQHSSKSFPSIYIIPSCWKAQHGGSRPWI